jgi:hypothetical protein
MRPLLLAICTVLAGCAAEPVPYHSQNEIPRGPGLLTGPAGEFVLNSDDYRQYQEWRKSKERQGQGLPIE